MVDLGSPSREELCGLVLLLREEVERLKAELSKRDTNKPRSRPEFRANQPQKSEDSTPRRKRKKAHVRRYETPTTVVEHVVDDCPKCGRHFEGGWVSGRSQVIDIPLVPYEVTEHVIIRRRCGVCGCVATPKASGQGRVGQSRFGPNVTSLVTHLVTEGRMPLERVQEFLQTAHGLAVSEGALVNMLHRVAQAGENTAADILSEIRESPVVHADETSWREEGRNAYVWSLSTAESRYYDIRDTRASKVPQELLGPDLSGTLVTDFFSGYSPLTCTKQRCWVHLLRDMKSLKEKHPNPRGIGSWYRQFQKLYRRCKSYRARELKLGLDEDAEGTKLASRVLDHRAEAKAQFETEALRLTSPYRGTDDPRRILSERVFRFLPELFVFIVDPRVPPENNAAERAVRPMVVSRKVSGGTRSKNGSWVKSILMTLTATWRLRGLNTMDQCLNLVASAPA